ncbi:MAG: hypothetical protein H6741_24420 [Alphaproteobacteria bacterium]|nr:hypothetical protein [Alphaproteobacteria bacterium]
MPEAQVGAIVVFIAVIVLPCLATWSAGLSRSVVWGTANVLLCGCVASLWLRVVHEIRRAGLGRIHQDEDGFFNIIGPSLTSGVGAMVLEHLAVHGMLLLMFGLAAWRWSEASTSEEQANLRIHALVSAAGGALAIASFLLLSDFMSIGARGRFDEVMAYLHGTAALWYSFVGVSIALFMVSVLSLWLQGKTGATSTRIVASPRPGS